ncbi:HlyD family secretion protein [Salinisphaera hydrothermalis]|uniref:Secretion protein HlyD n=1 Tax=Salinisphaera hydrothermalis (strain C41B8) TaxID=1304275 RepID=A0A084ILA8_SALHC|nr:HlyD family secretion protein [Salinisphaera hydrothermalis]KEZ77492.1 secretion protein HlyD [Salinisphaera hydrothermalis C41B8]
MANAKNILKTTARVAATLVIVAIAGVLGWFAWQHYVYAPWTRDARVQADVINIAPEVSGTVTDVAVADDSYVHKGDLLFKIQPIRYKHNVAEAKANLLAAKASLAYSARNARRLERLPPGGVSTQNLQQAQSAEQRDRASVAQYKAQLAQAKQNLEWATVRSPVNGYVTHLLLDQGDYATQGSPAMTLVDAETFRVTAYFEETKLSKIAVGDPAEIVLMDGDKHFKGHVASIGRGIAIPNNAKGERNLPNVDPTFQWVRLAQRVPVTIAFDRAPQKLPLSVGLTATVHVHPNADKDNGYDASAHKGNLRWSPARAGQFDDSGQSASSAGQLSAHRTHD